MSNQKVPALRLGGFDGEWGNSTFADLIDRSTLMSTEPSLPRVEYEDLVSGAGVLNKDLRFKDSTKTGIRFRPGDVLYGKLRPYLKNWLLADFDGLAVGDFWVLRPKRIDSRLLYALIQTDAFSSIAGVSSGSKMPRADWKLVSSTSFLTPPTPEEQQAIGAIFTNLDAAINQHTLKHTSLQQSKTALMQRMFPQEGQTVPELRLEGFSGEWEETSMASIASFNKGTGYSKNDFRASGTPLFHYGRLYTNYQLAVTDVDTFAQLRPGSVLSRGDEVLIPSSGETAEDIATACALLQEGVILGGDLNIVRPTPGYDNVFLALSLSQGATKAELERKAQGKTVVHIHNSDIRSLDVAFPPTLEEQQAIGAIFTNLDQLIAAEAQYIKSLSQAKTALLQRMFV